MKNHCLLPLKNDGEVTAICTNYADLVTHTFY